MDSYLNGVGLIIFFFVFVIFTLNIRAQIEARRRYRDKDQAKKNKRSKPLSKVKESSINKQTIIKNDAHYELEKTLANAKLQVTCPFCNTQFTQTYARLCRVCNTHYVCPKCRKCQNFEQHGGM